MLRGFKKKKLILIEQCMQIVSILSHLICFAIVHEKIIIQYI